MHFTYTFLSFFLKTVTLLLSFFDICNILKLGDRPASISFTYLRSVRFDCNNIYIYLYLEGFLITLSPSRPFTAFYVQQFSNSSKVAIIKTKNATIAFFSSFSPPFLLLALSFSPYLFHRYYYFGVSRA